MKPEKVKEGKEAETEGLQPRCEPSCWGVLTVLGNVS